MNTQNLQVEMALLTPVISFSNQVVLPDYATPVDFIDSNIQHICGLSAGGLSM